MIVIDRLLASGLKFVLGRVADAADAEMDEEPRLREELLEAQMRFELGEMTRDEFAAFEADVLSRLREIREREQGKVKPGDLKVSGVETEVYGEDEK